MKSVLIVVALLVSTVYVECSSSTDLLDQLDELLLEATRKNNKAAVDAISDAIDTVGLALLSMPTKDEATKALMQSHVDIVRSELPKLENMVKKEIKTRGFMKAVGGAFNFVTSKASLLTQKVQSILGKFAESGFGGLVTLLQPFLENILNNPQLKQMVGGLEIVTNALNQLNKVTGGMFAPLNTVTDILSNIESTGKLFEEMTSANSSDAIADALINTLTTAKSSHLTKIEKALDYVCNGLDDVQKSE